MTEKAGPQGHNSNQENLDYTTLSWEGEKAYIYENLLWQGGKSKLDNWEEYTPTISHPDNGYKLIELASEMYEFDPKRFNEDIEISDYVWQEYFEVLNNNKIRYLDKILEEKTNNEIEREIVYSFLKAAAPLKKLNPRRFKKDVNMKEKHFGKVTEVVKKDCDYIQRFMRVYEYVLSIYEGKAKDHIQISENDWRKFMEAKENEKYKIDLWDYAIAQNRIKPKGYPDIIFSQEEWGEMKEHLADNIIHGYADKDIFRCIDTLKHYKGER